MDKLTTTVIVMTIRDLEDIESEHGCVCNGAEVWPMTQFKNTTLTFPLQEETEQGRCHGDCFMVVVIVVDWQ